MKGRVHAVATFALAVPVALAAWGAWPGLGLAACCALGALLPDVDHPASPVARLGGLGEAAAPIRRGVRGASRWLREHAGGHRGATHSLLGAALLTLLVVPVTVALGAPAVGWALAAGYLLHVLEDAPSGAGVPLLWPLPWRWRAGIPFPIRGRPLRRRRGGWRRWRMLSLG